MLDTKKKRAIMYDTYSQQNGGDRRVASPPWVCNRNGVDRPEAAASAV